MDEYNQKDYEKWNSQFFTSTIERKQRWKQHWETIKQHFDEVDGELNITKNSNKIQEQILVEFLIKFLGMSESYSYKLVEIWVRNSLVKKENKNILFF